MQIRERWRQSSCSGIVELCLKREMSVVWNMVNEWMSERWVDVLGWVVRILDLDQRMLEVRAVVLLLGSRS